MNSGVGQKSTEPRAKRTMELLIFSSNSRPDLAGARVGKAVFLQYKVDLGTHCQRMSWMIEVTIKREAIYCELLN